VRARFEIAGRRSWAGESGDGASRLKLVMAGVRKYFC
jgi:hypothetical protein